MTDEPGKPGWRAVFGAPIAIGLLSLVGLLSALWSDGLGRVFSWIALSIPIAIIGCALLRSRK